MAKPNRIWRREEIKTALLLIGALIQLTNGVAQTTDCSVYFHQSDSVASHFGDMPESAMYFTQYKNCLQKDTSANAHNEFNKIKDFDLLSRSANKKGGWAYANRRLQLYLLDSALRIINPLPYTDFRFFANENICPVRGVNGYWLGMDYTGKRVTTKPYQDIRRFSDGMAVVKINDLYGFIDNTGKEVIPAKYTFAFNFSEGFAGVHQQGKYGFVNKKGKPITPFKYTFVHDFTNGFAIVEISQRFSFINKNGKEITPLKYGSVKDFQNGMAVVLSADGKFGVINEQGKEIVPLIYTSPIFMINGLAEAEQNGKYIRFNNRGEIVE